MQNNFLKLKLVLKGPFFCFFGKVLFLFTTTLPTDIAYISTDFQNFWDFLKFERNSWKVSEEMYQIQIFAQLFEGYRQKPNVTWQTSEFLKRFCVPGYRWKKMSQSLKNKLLWTKFEKITTTTKCNFNK